MKYMFLLMVVVVSASTGFSQKYHPTEQAVRDVVEKWNDGYRKMDSKAMSATIGEELDFVNRSGERFRIYSREEYEKLLSWSFTNLDKEKPGSHQEVDSVRFITPDVAIVHSTTMRYEKDKPMPEVTQIATFVLVKKNDAWLIASHTVNSRVTDSSSSAKLPPTKN